MNSNCIRWMFLFVAIASQCFADQGPNILFIIADDASLEHFGANGCSWEMEIDTIALRIPISKNGCETFTRE